MTIDMAWTSTPEEGATPGHPWIRVRRRTHSRSARGAAGPARPYRARYGEYLAWLVTGGSIPGAGPCNGIQRTTERRCATRLAQPLRVVGARTGRGAPRQSCAANLGSAGMATVGHLAVGFALSRLAASQPPITDVAVITIAAAIPDVDFLMPIDHRGITHSLGAAVAVGIAVAIGYRFLERSAAGSIGTLSARRLRPTHRCSPLTAPCGPLAS